MSYINDYTGYKIEDLRYKSGVYTITNKLNKKVYVGGAINFYDRFRLHIADLLKNKHFNPYLQNAVNKYGINNFEFEILEEHPIELTFQMEAYWINLLDSTNDKLGYNINRFPTRLGAILSRETKEKIANSLRGRKQTSEQIRKAWENNPIKRKIIQLDLEGRFLKEFDTITQASIELGIKNSNITRVAKRKSKTAKNFVFVYSEEYDKDKNYKTKKYK